MTENNLLTRLEAYLNLNAKRRKKKADELKAIIGKLKKKEKALMPSSARSARARSAKHWKSAA